MLRRASRPDLGFNDYKGLDVKGKIVVVLTGFPKGTPSELGAHLNSEKAVMAMKRGAVAVISVPTIEDTARRPWPPYLTVPEWLRLTTTLARASAPPAGPGGRAPAPHERMWVTDPQPTTSPVRAGLHRGAAGPGSSRRAGPRR